MDIVRRSLNKRKGVDIEHSKKHPFPDNSKASCFDRSNVSDYQTLEIRELEIQAFIRKKGKGDELITYFEICNRLSLPGAIRNVA